MITLPPNVVDIITNAEGKALATYVPDCLHVVPVSTVKVKDDKILLVNYFMGQTLSNLQANPQVSLACWRGLSGYQIKGEVAYVTSGEVFDEIKNWVAEILPDRVVKGVLIITPKAVYDVSATIEKPGQKIL